MTAPDTTGLPGAWRLGLLRGGLERKQFFRLRDQVVFSLAFPVVLLVLLAPNRPPCWSRRAAGSSDGSPWCWARGASEDCCCVC